MKYASISLNNKSWFSEYLFQNKNIKILEKCISINGLILEYSNEEFRDDKEAVFQAIKQNGRAYQFASDHLKQNEELKQLALEDDSITDKNEILEMFK